MREFALSADIAVVGAGPAGLSAAISAAREGKKVLLLEKNGFWAAMLRWACRCWVFWM